MKLCKAVDYRSRCKPLIRLYTVGTQSDESRQYHWECCKMYVAFTHKCDHYRCQNIFTTLHRFHKIVDSSERNGYDWAISERSLLLHDSLAFAELTCQKPWAKPGLSWLPANYSLWAKPASMHFGGEKYQCSSLALHWNPHLELTQHNWPSGQSLWID